VGKTLFTIKTFAWTPGSQPFSCKIPKLSKVFDEKQHIMVENNEKIWQPTTVMLHQSVKSLASSPKTPVVVIYCPLSKYTRIPTHSFFKSSRSQTWGTTMSSDE